MAKLRNIAVRSLFAVAVVGMPIVACQGPEAFYRDTAGSGSGGSGSPGNGGSGAGGTFGSGGATGKGGTTGAGGIATGLGGTTGTGGIKATGGTTGTGGIATGLGGTTGTGGIKATGGTTGTGGIKGTGGTTGTGGIKGTGGTTGSGGTTGTGGATGTGGSSGCAGCKILVLTDCQMAGNNQVGLYLDVENNSSATVPLSQITFRYWFTMGAIPDMPTMDIDYAAMVPKSDITFKYVAVSPAVTGANEYLEVGFLADATFPSLGIFSDTGQIQLRMHATGYSNLFDPSSTSDYSFQACGAGQTANMGTPQQQTTITAYINGVLSSGTEPM